MLQVANKVHLLKFDRLVAAMLPVSCRLSCVIATADMAWPWLMSSRGVSVCVYVCVCELVQKTLVRWRQLAWPRLIINYCLVLGPHLAAVFHFPICWHRSRGTTRDVFGICQSCFAISNKVFIHIQFSTCIYSINIACQLLLPGVMQAFGRWFFAALLLTVSENLWHNAGGDAGLKLFEFVAAAAAAAMAHKDIKLNRNISELPQSDRKQRRSWPPRLIYGSNSDCQTVRKVRFVNAQITSDF